MPLDRFMIAPIEGGQVTSVRPWLIPDNAFSNMQNAYVYRGRITKRFGSRWMDDNQYHSRLRINLTDPSGSQATSGTLPDSFTAPTALDPNFLIGMSFSIVNASYMPPSEDQFIINQVGAGVTTLSTNANFTITIDTTLSPLPITWTLTGTLPSPVPDVYFYPALPVMGICNFQLGVSNDQPTYAFDQFFAYQFIPTQGWSRLAKEAAMNTGASVWTPNNSNPALNTAFYWTSTWIGTGAQTPVLYVTNFNDITPDYIRAWDNTSWTYYKPVVVGTTILDSCRIILPFHNRLVAINGTENGASYVNRLWYSAFGNTDQATAWRRDVGGQGGFADAYTKDSMITAQILKDRLIVFGQNSSWEVVYTNNNTVPFLWQQIDIVLGAESSFSAITFNDFILTVGNVGIHMCAGDSVRRIDENIPQQVYDITGDNGGITRVVGIRDYFNELAYWTIPVPRFGTLADNSTIESIFPTRVLIYNYLTKSWAYNDDSFTFFGYYNLSSQMTWGAIQQQWGQITATWGSPQINTQYRKIVGGNQEGYVVYVAPEVSRNAGMLQITQISIDAGTITVAAINHNIFPSDYVLLENIQGAAQITVLNGNIYQVESVIDANTFTCEALELPIAVDVYKGGGTVTRVSQINMQTKEYNFYADKGLNCYIPYVDFLINREVTSTNDTLFPQIKVDYLNSSAQEYSMTDNSTTTGAIMGTGVLELTPYALAPFEQEQNRLWHRVYFQGADAECVQFSFYYDDNMMLNPSCVLRGFTLHTFVISARPTSPLASWY